MKSKEIIEILNSHDIIVNDDRMNEGFLQIYEPLTDETYALYFDDSDNLSKVDDGRTMIIYCDKIELVKSCNILLFYKGCEIGKIIASTKWC